ncbi:hypothetical protein WCX49_11655 [Sulfurimonas sp. HSL-1656]|uniref:hypothetical protein n=1 Tax=Thiomicrolovo subterrani TaxID=3131934 RepID=UPI0031F7EDDB
MYSLKTFWRKVRNKISQKLIRMTRNSAIYPLLYRSWWHSRLHSSAGTNGTAYFAARPNPGAGIGHQMANWIAGLWFAKQFGLGFAHLPFSSDKWEDFFGFGRGEVSVEELASRGYRIVRLPLFNENNAEEVARVRDIIRSYGDKNVVFLAEQDQFYADQFGVMEELKQKFYAAPARRGEHLLYDEAYFNIAIHVRRGDIVAGQANKNPNLLMRWQSNDYFAKVLTNVIENLLTEKPVRIYLFSQGKPEDFADFNQFENVHFCLEMGAMDSFLHMVYADLLITSKSSFSYKPALLSNGIKVCPDNFWHGYPNSEDWILADDNGKFDGGRLREVVGEKQC